MAFKDLRNFQGNLLFFMTWIIRSSAFVFVLKLKVYTDLEQLLT